MSQSNETSTTCRISIYFKLLKEYLSLKQIFRFNFPDLRRPFKGKINFYRVNLIPCQPPTLINARGVYFKTEKWKSVNQEVLF